MTLTQADILTLKGVSDNFIYTSDRDQFGKRDAWYVMREKPYRGDCEDFALTVLYNIKGRSLGWMLLSLITFQSRIHFCDAPNGVAHSTLRYGQWYTDNWQLEWLSKAEYVHKGYVFSKIQYNPLTAILQLVRGYFIHRGA